MKLLNDPQNVLLLKESRKAFRRGRMAEIEEALQLHAMALNRLSAKQFGLGAHPLPNNTFSHEAPTQGRRDDFFLMKGGTEESESPVHRAEGEVFAAHSICPYRSFGETWDALCLQKMKVQSI
ncbi:hypothetical protein NPIL_137581 [Nephila pilipes]|uniref:Uncharacterized protein n=1 Tax=Nephila pilipes TaxID=299642 RepID=A0A8X6N2S1_NEPPI|nr:hypothetical protein NPIL_137581 [Nephila pilipes]